MAPSTVMLAPAVHSRTTARTRFPRWLVPSLSDCLFLAILLWGFAAGNGWISLLSDGDTGWHIRTGEYILDTRSVPTHDLFSFSKAGEAWFAWEWLSDVAFAVLHRLWGLKGVVVFTGLVLSLAATMLYRYAVWCGANVLAALLATLLATGASTVHYLARPHIFSILGLTTTLWMLERDRRHPSRAVWWLVPLMALWTNLHGGFLAGLACILFATADRLAAMWRHLALLASCSFVTLVNPYGWRLHQHLAQYLTSDWIRQVVEEFQSPRFRSESMLQFEILLFGGLALTPILFQRKQFAAVVMVVFWAHAALASTRHVPLYAVVAAPLIAAEVTWLWARSSAHFGQGSVGGILRDCLNDFSRGAGRSSVWVPVLLLCLSAFHWDWPEDFPSTKFPVRAVAKRAVVIVCARRILTTDQWGDYLIYHLYPRGRVFVDGRSDFYGPGIGRQYLDLLNAAPNWEQTLNANAFDLALLPVDWPLVRLMECRTDWHIGYRDSQAVLLERAANTGLNQKPKSAE